MQAVTSTNVSATAIAVVLKGYPRLSETFIAQELRALEQRGLVLYIIALRRPTDALRHVLHRQIKAPVHYLPEYLYQQPKRLWRAFVALRKTTAYTRARATWLRDLMRDRSFSRVRRFGQALILSHELADNVSHLYAHFLHTPTSVARYTALLRDLPFSVSAHAKDIWTLPAWEKREKIAAAAWTVTCTAYNHHHLQQLSTAGTVTLLYHGIDSNRFPSVAVRSKQRNGCQAEDPVRLLSVGRLVAKKGYSDLLCALASLPAGLHWRLTHIGAGPLASTLKRQSQHLGLSDRIDWRGSQTQSEVIAAYASSDMFALASVVAADGDRDGLPNVLLEAQYMQLPVVATRVSAIPELVAHQINGLLVKSGDSVALAQALEDLMRNPQQRALYGAGGRERVERLFSFKAGIDYLVARFQEKQNSLCRAAP